MKRNQAIKMLRQWHEECIKAAKALPAPFHAIVEEQERTYTDGTCYKYEAGVWQEDISEPATPTRRGDMYSFYSDEDNIANYNEQLEAFKADVERIVNEHKNNTAA